MRRTDSAAFYTTAEACGPRRIQRTEVVVTFLTLF
jgi:hypothetical protein